MNKKTTGIIVAFIVGQITQLVIHGVELSVNMWANRQIPFCLAGGFVILVALMAGVMIASSRDEQPEHEKDVKKDYLFWARVPGKNKKVVEAVESGNE